MPHDRREGQPYWRKRKRRTRTIWFGSSVEEKGALTGRSGQTPEVRQRVGEEIGGEGHKHTDAGGKDCLVEVEPV